MSRSGIPDHVRDDQIEMRFPCRRSGDSGAGSRRHFRVHGVVCPFFIFSPSQPGVREHVSRRGRPRRAQIAGDLPDPGGVDAVLPGVAIAARRAAAPAAMHPAPRAPTHGRRSARCAGAGARAAAWGVRQYFGLWGRVRGSVRSIVEVRWSAAWFVHRVPFDRRLS